ncbi:alpha-D-ribose 1-methylphosphonate 5-triphosphate diphosphatase [Magnetovibrio blakemorei]|uniref:Alpha-D-ribose 1-methylphosphonate 5-triphosphate diphosphatase n=2 Tax=Magnetovibrio blakemorei TaxID=28181 RepID=A0A1E5Q8H4_9PROT|nr:alpha-D-ribose 1-methylphosphonate 5-triphosphate diphosphatase [Magnetovibrio blakemorei]
MLSLVGGRVLLEDGTIGETDIHIEGGLISGIDDTRSNGKSAWNVRGYLVLPAVIDLHGDAFERQIMPRPGVHFPLDLALQETDSQMISNGISTAFYGITYSWEPGLRGRDTAVELLDALDTIRPHLVCDTRVHLRWETYNTPGADDVAEWIETGRIDLLAFNDHLDMIQNALTNPQKLAKYASRSGLSTDAFIQLVGDVAARKNEVDAHTARLAKIAERYDIPCASHDDESPEMRGQYHKLGVSICEFPVNAETARFSIANGDPVIMGAPNVLRGGSHCNRLCAATAAREGLCSILTSDYYYPALLRAPFKLAADGVTDFATAWHMVSKNPAHAAGLEDRGTLSKGQRADIVVIDDSNPNCVRVIATFVAGKPVYMFDAGYRMCA